MLKNWLLNIKLMVQLCALGILILAIVATAGGISFMQMQQVKQMTEMAELVNKSQFHMKTQVQEWKNLLLRGHNPERFEQYLAAMKQNAEIVDELLIEIKQNARQAGLSVDEVDRIHKIHIDMTEGYIKGLKWFDSDRVTSYRAVDASVKGIDREPLAVLQAMADDLNHRATLKSEAALRIELIAFIVAALVASLVALLYARNLSGILQEIVAVVVKVGQGDLKSRCVSQGSNELGVLSAEVNRMADSLSELTSNMHVASSQLSESAANMAIATKEQEATTAEQAASTQQIVVSSQEISQTAKELLNNMGEVANAVDIAASMAQEGNDDLQRMENVLNGMVQASKVISQKLAALNEKTSNISMVVTTINKVSDQTNLLSVNAAIEADKAGEAGVGFSTVASEIRRLADQTAVATWDIEQLVKEIQTAVSSGVMGMEKFHEDIDKGVFEMRQVSGKLGEIVEQVRILGPHFEAVHEGMESQTLGAEQISEGMSQLSETVTNLLESIRFSNQAIEEVNNEASTLQAACSKISTQG